MFKKNLLFCGVCLILSACASKPAPPPAPTAVSIEPTPTRPVCVPDIQNLAVGQSLLPVFEPSSACELENVSRHESCQMENEQGVYNFCRQESVTEQVVGQGEDFLLIKRDYHSSDGCWTGVTTQKYAVRVCQPSTGKSAVVDENLIGEVVPSPNQTKYAFLTMKLNSTFETHLFMIEVGSVEAVQLDTQPLPQSRAVGGTILGWSEDGEWVEVSLWDGREGSYHLYQIRADGSGEFVALTPEPVE